MGCMVRWQQRAARGGGAGLTRPGHRGLGPSCPNICPPSIHIVFNKDFLYLPPTNQAKGGAWSGEQDRGPDLSKETVHCQTLRVDTHLPIHSCAQDSCPHPWTQGKHLPGSLGVGSSKWQDSPWTVCGLATLTSWGLLPPLPLLIISTELPVQINLGIFSGG